MPDSFVVLKESLGLILLISSVIGALASGLGFLIGKWRKERNAILTLVTRLDDLAVHMKCVEDQNATRAMLAQANLRLSFNVAQELVNQGANGDLKRAVNDLREMVITNSIPPKAHGLPDERQK